MRRVSAGEEGLMDTSSFLEDPSLFQELLQGDLFQSQIENRNLSQGFDQPESAHVKSLFENRSISEVA